MARHKVDICGVNTANLKVLSNEEMVDLFRKYNEGDMFAKEDLVNGNLKLVLSILRKYNNRCDNMDDLFQVGCIGLIKAIDNFDLSYGLKLSTYAIPLIIGEVKRFIRDNQSSVKVSRSIKDRAYQILSFKEEYCALHGVEPDCEIIAKHFDITVYEVSNSLDSIKEPVSIFEPIFNDGGDALFLCDQIADQKEQNENRDIKILLNRCLLKLKERERNILLDRYIVGKTQVEIAERLNISQAQVSRIEKSAIKNMKKFMK